MSLSPESRLLSGRLLAMKTAKSCVLCAAATVGGSGGAGLLCRQLGVSVSWDQVCADYLPFLFAGNAQKTRVVGSSARSDEGARTDDPTTPNRRKTDKKSAGVDLGFSDLRRCSTADQSRLRDF